MIVCVCKNVNSGQIRQAVNRGLSLEDIAEELGVGTGCGGCLEYAVNMVQRENVIASSGQAA